MNSNTKIENVILTSERRTFMSLPTEDLPAHLQGLEMTTFIIYNPWPQTSFLQIFDYLENPVLEVYFPNFPPVKLQLTSMDQGQVVINS